VNTPNTDSRPNPESRPGSEPRRPLSTADLAAAGTEPTPAAEAAGQREAGREREAARQRSSTPEMRVSTAEARASRVGATEAEKAAASDRATESARPAESDRLEELFPPDTAAQFRKRWTDVQGGFVDDPRRAVAAGDELVAEVMKSLAESFAHERTRLESDLARTGEASTETLRVGLRRYRSFFERLLAL